MTWRRIAVTVLALSIVAVGAQMSDLTGRGQFVVDLTPGTFYSSALASADRSAVAQPVAIGATADGEQVAFTISLTQRNRGELADRLSGLADPASPYYRDYVSAAEFGERYGLAAANLARVSGWLQAAGLNGVATPQRTSLSVSGTAGAVKEALGVSLIDWQTAAGTRFHRPDGTPSVPDDIRASVAAIVGLDTEPNVRSAVGPRGPIHAAGVPEGGLVPATVRRAYEIDPLHAAGIQGQGQTIAILSLDALTPSDVDLFDERYGITGPEVETVKIAGALQTPGDETAEVALDVQVVRGIAPQAQIINYEGPKTGAGIAALMARIVSDGRADIVSISWGGCEKMLGDQNMRAIDLEFEAAFAAGMSVFVASGDNGAYGCRRFPVSANPLDRDNAASASYPASSPNVISVGGTFLTTLADGTYVSEAGWEEPLSTSGGGGGLSGLFDRPSWQVGAGVDNSDTNGRRQLPDIGAAADPASGFFIVYTSPGQGLASGPIGGTSAAAPMWAGSMALTRQLAENAGIDGLGTLAPVLYQIAAEQAPGAVFHDVIRGGNLLHEAGPGWDYSTGLGTPRVAQLSQAIVEFLSR